MVTMYVTFMALFLLPQFLTSLVVLFIITSMINSPNSYLHEKKYRV